MHLRCMAQRLDHRKFFLGKEADQRAAAGTDVAQFVGHLIFIGRSYAVAAELKEVLQHAHIQRLAEATRTLKRLTLPQSFKISRIRPVLST